MIMVFLSDKGGAVRVPWQTVQTIEYGQRVSRRWKTAMFLTPWAVFSKGRKHMVTIAYKDPAGVDEAAVFEESRRNSGNGVELHYGDEGTAVPVVFVHGGLEDYRAWQPQMAAFSQRHRTIAESRRRSLIENATEWKALTQSCSC